MDGAFATQDQDFANATAVIKRSAQTQKKAHLNEAGLSNLQYRDRLKS